MSEFNQLQKQTMEVPLFKQEQQVEDNLLKTGFKQDETDQLSLQSEQWMQSEEQEIPEQVLNEKIAQAYAQTHNGAKIGKMERYKAKKEFKKKLKVAKSVRKIKESIPPVLPDDFTGMEPANIQESIKATFAEMKAVDLKQFDYTDDTDFLERYQKDRATLVKGADLDNKVRQFIGAGGYMDSFEIEEINVLSATYRELLSQRDARMDMFSNPYHLMLREKDFAKMSEAKLNGLSKSENKSMQKLASALLNKKKNMTSEQVGDEQKVKVRQARIDRLSAVQKGFKEGEAFGDAKYRYAELGVTRKLHVKEDAALHYAGITDRTPTKFSLVFLNYCAKTGKSYFDPMGDEDWAELKKTSDEVLDTIENNNTVETAAPLLRNMFKGLMGQIKAVAGEGGSVESRFKSILPRYDDSGEVLGKKLSNLRNFKAFFKDCDQLLGGEGHAESALKAMDGVTEEELKLYQTISATLTLYTLAEEIPNTGSVLRHADQDDIEKLVDGKAPGLHCGGSKFSWKAYEDYLIYAEKETEITCKSLDEFVKNGSEVHLARPEIYSANFLPIEMNPETRSVMMEQMKLASDEVYKEQQENIDNSVLHLGPKLRIKIENGKASNIA